MNVTIFALACSLASGVALGFPQTVRAQASPDSADSAPPAIAELPRQAAADQTPPEEPPHRTPRPRGKRINIERRDTVGRVRVEQRNEVADVLRESPGEGGDVRIERHIYRNGPGDEQDVIIRRGPNPALRAEIRPLPPGGPFALPVPPRGEFSKDRAEHLEQAIHHLHEAGMDALADRLQTRLDNLRPERREPPPGDNRLREELDRLKEEHQKLEKELRKLQKELRENGPKKKDQE